VPVDLDDVVRIEMDRAELPATLALDASRITHVEVLGRPDELGRVVRNLLDNASRHARSTVGVELAHDGRMATLVVSDDGDGIAPEERERIFERFTRLDDSRSRDTGGSGLGLAIVREIVTGHRGTVTLEPDDGRTRFVVRLPAAES
jgi:signal transduction histidine kinase